MEHEDSGTVISDVARGAAEILDFAGSLNRQPDHPDIYWLGRDWAQVGSDLNRAVSDALRR